MKFVNRKPELNAIEQFTQDNRAGLLIVFGRRRVGKTRLLTQFLESKPDERSFFWTATTHGAPYQLRSFSQALLDYDPRFNSIPSLDFSFSDWEAALNHVADIVEQSGIRQFIILDEFTYLIQNDPAITSVFQKLWDHRLSNLPNLRLVLMGSLVGMMEREVLSYQAPLYGRATAMLRLRPLPYAAFVEIFPDRTPAERVAIYSVCGGVPAYLELFTRSSSFVTALQDHCLGPGSIMLTDPALILHDQIQEPHTFESVLSAIASGFHKWGEIARMAGISESSLGHYLKILQELELIERRDPILSPPSSRRGRYYVQDHFLRFYYRFIIPQITTINRGFLEPATKKINKELRSFIGTYVFEELCREWVISAAAIGELDFLPSIVGAYWRRYRGKGVQLDVVAAAPSEKRLLVGEAKWGKGKIGRNILFDLIDRSQRMPQVAEGWRTTYVAFAREGFSDAAFATGTELDMKLLTLSEIERTLIDAAKSIDL